MVSPMKVKLQNKQNFSEKFYSCLGLYTFIFKHIVFLFRYKRKLFSISSIVSKQCFQHASCKLETCYNKSQPTY